MEYHPSSHVPGLQTSRRISIYLFFHFGFKIFYDFFLGHKLSIVSVLRPATSTPFTDNIAVTCSELDSQMLKPCNCFRKSIRISGLENIYDITPVFHVFNRFHGILPFHGKRY